LELGSDRPHVLGTKGWLRPHQFAFVPRLAILFLCAVVLIFHGHADRLCGTFAGLGSALC
ncbi:MAG: hypothetical protein ACR2PG_11925, partial [Hyphomicrobiaceae bacterium]